MTKPTRRRRLRESVGLPKTLHKLKQPSWWSLYCYDVHSNTESQICSIQFFFLLYKILIGLHGGSLSLLFSFWSWLMLQVAFEREATSPDFLYFEFCFDLEIKLHRAPKFCKTHSIPNLNLASVGGGWWEAVGSGWRCFQRWGWIVVGVALADSLSLCQRAGFVALFYFF